jgi:hypothetical protein
VPAAHRSKGVSGRHPWRNIKRKSQAPETIMVDLDSLLLQYVQTGAYVPIPEWSPVDSATSAGYCGA